MAEARTELRRELKLLDATMLVVGSMIGSGIFIVSADIARYMGSSGWILLVWVVSAIMTLIPATSYGELAGMHPQAGGQYVYLREAFSPLVGFLFGWTFFLVIQCGTIAAVAVAFAKFTGVIIPWFSEKNILFEAGSYQVSAAQLLAIVQIGVLTHINMRGVREGKFVQNLFTLTKIAVLLLVIGLGIFIAGNPEVVVKNFANMWAAVTSTVKDGVTTTTPLSGTALLTAFGLASVGSLFALDAWNSSTFTAAETKDPRKTVAKSLALGTGLVALLYILTNVAYLFLLPITGDVNGADTVSRGIAFATSDRVATAATETIFGGAATVLIAVAVMISTFGCNNGIVLTGARVYYAMAQHGLFFKSVGKLNKKDVPGVALAVQGIWAGVLCLSGKYGDLLDYVTFAAVLFYIFTVYGIFRLRKLRPNDERPVRAPGYPYFQILYIALAALFCINLIIYKPNFTWPGLIIVLLGLPVYYLWHHKKESAA
ncbi:amino acid permease [bacterium]|nr:amino acid permease [bacterium]